MTHVLVVDDEANLRRVLVALLEQAGHGVTAAASGEEAMDLVRAQDPDVVISDLRMPGMDGLTLLDNLRRDFAEIPVVLLTAHGTVDTAVEAMKRGAHDFLTKPFDKERVLEVVDAAARRGERWRTEFQGPLVPTQRAGMVGSSAALARVRELVEKLAATPATVLITGETGTGKELVAAAIHSLSDRSDAPFVAVNCGALPESLVDSELFGHEKGAFTGATHRKPGRFELADGGVLFLDEVGELQPDVQVRLLRVLQEGVVDVVGGTRPLQVDVRLVAATNRDLDASVAEGAFRQDLLYRLRVVEIRVPALRDRLEDVPELVTFFLEKHARRLGRDVPDVTDEAVAALRTHSWPGNVRELEHAIERAVLLGEGSVLGPSDFGLGAPPPDASAPTEATDIKAAARVAAAQAEERVIRGALEETGGNVTRAAEIVGLSRRGLQLKMKELGLR